MRRFALMGFVVSLAVAMALPAMAQPWGGRGRGWGKGRGMGRGMRGGAPGAMFIERVRGLGLSKDQEQELRAIEADVLPRLQATRGELDGLRAKMWDLRSKPTPEWDGVMELRVQMRDARARLHATVQELHGRVLSILTDEQKTRLWAMRGPRMGRMGRGPCRGGMGPWWAPDAPPAPPAD